MKYHIYIVGILLMFMSCKPKAPQEVEAHAGHNHDAKLQLIAYNSQFELFAESDPFIEGTESSILAHFTHLTNFKPLNETNISSILLVNGLEVEQSSIEFIKPGIFQIKLTPKNKGVGEIQFKIHTGDSVSVLSVKGVEVFTSVHEAHHTAEEQKIESGTAISFTKEQSWKMDFATSLPSFKPFGKIVKTVAKVAYAGKGEAILTAKTSGNLFFAKENLVEGMKLARGEVLCTIISNGIAKDNSSIQFIKAQNNLKKAQADYKRANKLAKDKIISEKELFDLKIKLNNAKAIFDTYSKYLNKNGQMVKSLQSGYLSKVFVKNGMYINAGDPIVSINTDSKLLLQAEIQAKFIARLDSFTDANIKSPISGKVYTLNELNGEVISIGRKAGDQHYLLPVTLQIDENREFIPGTFVDVCLIDKTDIEILTVPNSALLEEQGLFSVFVQLTPELFEKRIIKVGSSDGIEFEVLTGLSKDERVVTEGAMLVKLAQSSGALDPHSGHSH